MNNLDLKRVRWQQRFTNYTKAFNLLQTAVNQETPDLLQLAGIVQTFEFTFELGWKTIKDYLASEGIDTTTPREVIKQAFAYNIIGDGEVWLDALEKRNLLSHTYNEEIAKISLDLIKNHYYQILSDLFNFFKNKL